MPDAPGVTATRGLFGGALVAAGMAVPIAGSVSDAIAQPYAALRFNGSLDATQAPSGFQYDYNGATCTSYFNGGIEVAVREFAVSQQSQVQIDAYSVVGSPGCYDPNLHVRLYRYGDGTIAPANLVAQNDDCGSCTDVNGSYAAVDPFIDVELDRGRYLLAIGPSSLTDAEAASGFADGSFCAPCASFPGPVLSGGYDVEVYGDFVSDQLLVTILNASRGTTHTTLQEAVDLANPGDLIELSAGTLLEDGIGFANDKPLTIQGAGRGETIIDGGGVSNFNDPILDFTGLQQSGMRITDLTLRNGQNATASGGGALDMSGPAIDVFFENVAFEDNRALNTTGGGAHVRAAGDATIPIFVNCTFAGGRNAFAALVFESGADPIFINAFVDAGPTPLAVEIEAGNAEIINSTFVNGPLSVVQSSAFVSLSNSVLTEAPIGPTTSIDSYRSVHPGAPDIEFDTVPTFVDEAYGDFTLAPGTAGVDVGDYTRYVNRGGTFFDAAGRGRFFDDPQSPNVMNNGSPIDAGAFELETSGDIAGCTPADIVAPFGIIDLDDVDEFIRLFLVGCP